jgi:CheY-like chemotaxis protein
MSSPQRILLVDDDPSIHEAYAKILAPSQAMGSTAADAVASARAAFLGGSVEPQQPHAGTEARLACELVHARQGEEACALAAETPFDLAFVDVRMPPGIDGVETVARLWQLDPQLEVVLCTAWSDYSHEQTVARLGRSHRLLVLKKPFEAIEVRQMALALTEKRAAARKVAQLLEEVQEASAETRAYATSLETANRALSLSKRAADHVARLQDERLLEVSAEVRELVTGALAGVLAGTPGPDAELALDRARVLLERVCALETEALERTRS